MDATDATVLDGNALNIQVSLNVFGILTFWRLFPLCFLDLYSFAFLKTFISFTFLKIFFIPRDCFKAFSFVLPGKQFGLEIHIVKLEYKYTFCNSYVTLPN